MPFHVATLVTLLAVSLAVRLLPFRRVANWAIGRAAVPNNAAPDFRLLRRAIDAWCRRIPWRTLCLEQGLTAARMLSGAGTPVTLYYGAAMIEGELKAHVWVQSGLVDIIGCENAADYAILSQFSNDSSSSQVQP